MIVTESMVKDLCEQARIEFEESEFENVIKDLQEMVDSFEILNEIDNVDSIKINRNTMNAETDLREDVPKEGLTVEAVIKNAPESCGGAIVIPSMVE